MAVNKYRIEEVFNQLPEELQEELVIVCQIPLGREVGN